MSFEWVVFVIWNIFGILGIFFRILLDYIVCWLLVGLFCFVIDCGVFFESKFCLVNVNIILVGLFEVFD